ncbi:hypothetical protein [Aquipuribacter hungaricus]|uniref:Uncharacterized protein n=1 Tax=Aquipuribacter hungaricus TaxID=545624 RepID=A0ABV7WBG4_9MICO
MSTALAAVGRLAGPSGLAGLAGLPSLLPLSSPAPSPAEVVRTPPPELVTPGTLGFLVTFAVAVALVLLVRDMVRRNRGLVVRAERRDAQLREAQAAAPDADAAPEADGAGPVLRDRSAPGDVPDDGTDGVDGAGRPRV